MAPPAVVGGSPLHCTSFVALSVSFLARGVNMVLRATYGKLPPMDVRDDTGSSGLRERTRRAVRAEIGYVAMRLFLGRGFEATTMRSAERRAGKECRSRWSPYH